MLMSKVDKYSLGYAIGNSIQENKDKIAKLEKKVENLKNKNKKLQRKLEEKDMIIDEAINYINKHRAGFVQPMKYIELSEILERGKNGK